MKNIKKIFAATVALTMLLSIFPLFGTTAGAPNRAGEIVISTIELKDDTNVSGVYSQGMHIIGLNYTLSVELIDVNITLSINNTNETYTDTNASNPGNLAAGDYVASLGVDFQAVGWYEIIYFVEGWDVISGGMVNESITRYMEFESLYYYLIYYEVTNTVMHQGKYPQSAMALNVDVYNFGNDDAGLLNVSLEIEDSGSQAEDLMNPFRETQVEPGNMAHVLPFPWVPSDEDTFDLTIKVTTDPVTSPNASTNISEFQLLIENTTSAHINISTPQPDTLYTGEDFTLRAAVRNYGNSKLFTTFILSYYPDGNPGAAQELADFYVENLQPYDKYFLEADLLYNEVSILEAGSFVLEIADENSSSKNTTMITVDPMPNQAPELMNVSVLPASPVNVGDPVTFDINYTDVDADPGSVSVFIDGTEYPMMPVIETVNWNQRVLFRYEWTATWDLAQDPDEDGQEFEYNFRANDGQGHNATLDDGGQNFTLVVNPPMYGEFKGIVKDTEDIGVAGAEIIILGNDYFNATCDANGNFSAMLAFGQYNIWLNDTWYEENGYLDGYPEGQMGVRIVTITLSRDNYPLTQNFVLQEEEIIPLPVFNGSVNDTDGNPLADVDVTLVIFIDEMSTLNTTELVGGVVKNITVNVTTRTWYNLTATTDSNGSYTIIGVPLNTFDIMKLTQTGMKKYREDLETLPSSAVSNVWSLMVDKPNKFEFSEATFSKKGAQDTMVNDTTFNELAVKVYFELGKTSFGNVTLEFVNGSVVEDKEFTVTGTITPANATVKIDDNEVTVTSGKFSIVLKGGNHTIVVSLAGYDEYTDTFTLAKNEDMIIELQLSSVTVTIGPFLDGDGNGLPGVKVTYNGVERLTDAQGIATFEEVLESDTDGGNIPAGTEIKFEFDSEKKTANWPLSEKDYNSFDQDTGDKKSEESNLLLIIAIIVIVLIIIILVVLALKSKGVPEDELMDDEIREYECPSCGAIVTSDMAECPECGEMFEEEEFRCPECGELVEMDATLCDNCGAEFEFPVPDEMDDEDMDEALDEDPDIIDDFEVEPDLDEEELFKDEEELPDPDDLPAPEDL